ncbi:MAG TPA: DUF1361 domain-containing protein [Polyangiaceae bacterium]|jgi:uncharacterized membrane protein|nr:DUF1361 domain-containing protein [Polyangiaceae bacterium]
MKSNGRLAWILLAGCALSIAALALRVHRTHSIWFGFMAWNLVLAMVPYCCARLLQTCWYRQRRVSITFVVIAFAWLVFFPNAPYVLTDVIHLGNDKLWWYDLPLVMAFAGTSWLAGLVSLAMVDDVLVRAAGSFTARAVVLATCWLSGLGVYLGRFLRFNSWDVIQSPRTLATTAVTQLVPPWRHAQPHAFALFFAALLLGSYATFRTQRVSI